MRMIFRLMSALTVFGVFATAPVMAKILTDSQVSKAPEVGHFFAYVIAIVIFICVCVISFTGAKRN